MVAISKSVDEFCSTTNTCAMSDILPGIISGLFICYCILIDVIASDGCSEASLLPYLEYDSHMNAHRYFDEHMHKNSFGHVCTVCERLWFRKDLTKVKYDCTNNIHTTLFKRPLEVIFVCSSCYSSLHNCKIPFFFNV